MVLRLCKRLLAVLYARSGGCLERSRAKRMARLYLPLAPATRPFIGVRSTSTRLLESVGLCLFLRQNSYCSTPVA